MNSSIRPWVPTSRWKPPRGHGLAVERDGQLGYAKADYIEKELLASRLAKLVGAPVTRVEIAHVGLAGRHAISYVNNEHSKSLGSDPHFEPEYSQEERQAARDASGLVPFLAWIDAEDHASPVNFVLEYDSAANVPRLVAVDFEDAFRWTAGEDKISVSVLRVFHCNMNTCLVERTIATIENLDDVQVRECCSVAFLPELAPILLKRAKLLRESLKGWVK